MYVDNNVIDEDDDELHKSTLAAVIWLQNFTYCSDENMHKGTKIIVSHYNIN